MRRMNTPKGSSLVEVLVVAAMLAVATGISFPLVTSAMQRAKANGAAEALAAAIRDARTRAIATGWQYQVVAYDPAGAVPNAFRVQGFDPVNGGVAPAAGTVTTPPFYGNNQTYEAYTNMAQDFSTAQIQVPGGGPFRVTFDSRGQWAVPCLPAGCSVQVTTPARQASLTVTQAGGVFIR